MFFEGLLSIFYVTDLDTRYYLAQISQKATYPRL